MFNSSLSLFQTKAHTNRLLYLCEKDLKRARAKLEDIFAKQESRDDRIKELEMVTKELAAAIDSATFKVEYLQAELSASASREAILQAQIGEQNASMGARISYLEQSRNDYASKEVV